MPTLVLALSATACSSAGPRRLVVPPATSDAGSASPAPRGDVDERALSALLLQASDVPDLPTRRAYADAALVRQLSPQLGLCDPDATDSPHEVANVLAEPVQPTAARVFEVVGVYADEATAAAVYARALATARRCRSFSVQGTAYTVNDLAELTGLPGTRALHYRLLTPAVVTGDVRTFAQKGRFTVLLTGYGMPPKGQALLDYQRGVLAKALARLPS